MQVWPNLGSKLDSFICSNSQIFEAGSFQRFSYCQILKYIFHLVLEDGAAHTFSQKKDSIMVNKTIKALFLLYHLCKKG